MATTTAAVGRRTADRELGTTESNWCAAVASGTGITLSSILFGHRLSLSRVEGAVRELLATNPRLRSNITRRNRTLWFETRDEEVSVNISEIDWNEAHGAGTGEEDGEEDEETEEATTAVVEEVWHRILEAEMNIPFPSVFPFPVFETKLYHLTAGTSFLVFRLHAAAADMSCTSTVARSFVDSLHRLDQLEKAGQKSIIKAAYQGSREEGEEVEEEELQQLPSMEAAIPPGQAKKPFWAHGVDVVGYGLSSRRHAYLPFRNSKAPRMSRFIPATLTIEATDQLLKDCQHHNLTLYGAIHAAALKAVASLNKVGDKGEHYGTTVLLQCRHRLQPVLPGSALGFYHSAMLRTTHTSETESFWDLAEKCSTDFDGAVKNRKHFTDMGDLNGLMMQAIRIPHLTPKSSLRTSVLSMSFDPVYEDLGEAAAGLDIKDNLACSSVHGVGPCLAIFPFLRNGCLRISFVYPSPLFSRSQIQKLVDSILFYLSAGHINPQVEKES